VSICSAFSHHAGRALENDLHQTTLSILALSSEGLTTPEVARRLAIPDDEVRSHLIEAMLELGTRSKLETVLKALRQGLIGTRPTEAEL
jgi:DNA-binding NarL/FixJ family response regulator